MDLELQKIVDQPISIANKVLYDICKNSGEYSWGSGTFLGGKIWLIGRSYAASPERRYYKKPDFKGKLELDKVGDGKGEYFDEIGTYIVDKSPEYKELLALVENLQDKFEFNGIKSDSDNDAVLLKKVVKAVDLLNKIVKKASKDYDDRNNKKIKDNVDYRNQISFCSKFLQFHCPHTVFIIDSFTQTAAKLLFSSKNKKQLYIGKQKINEEFKNEIKKYLPECSLESSDITKDYENMCKRSYAVCCYIKKSKLNKSKITYYPRISDCFFQNIKSK